MSIRDLVPWKREANAPVRRQASGVEVFHREINRLFDGFFDDFGLGLSPFGSFPEPAATAFSPAISVEETDKELVLQADLPGLCEKDVTIEVDDHALVLSGERSEESKGGKGAAAWSERRYGSFRRVIDLPPGVDADAAKATFKRGVLTVRMPRTLTARPVRTVDVEAE